MGGIRETRQVEINAKGKQTAVGFPTARCLIAILRWEMRKCQISLVCVA